MKPMPDTELDRLKKDAERYRAFRQLVRLDKVRAQALVWESGGSRKRLDRLVDQLKVFDNHPYLVHNN